VRNAFAEEVTRLGIADPRVVLLSGDIGNKLFDRFRQAAPERFLNCGVAEANMMGVAAGLALSGLRPVVYTIAPFTTTRCYEQIRVDVCYHCVPVVIVGTGAGLSYAELGPTHHSCEDLAIMRVLPEMTVLAPCDAVELRLALRAALRHDGPVYMRIGKKGEPVVHVSEPAFTIGRSITIRPGDGDALCILSTGNILPVVLDAASHLAQAGIAPRVESVHTVKPLDAELLRHVFATYRVVATVEEHGRAGGLGGSVAEWMADAGAVRSRLVRLGVDDRFLHEIGSQDWARRQFGLDAEAIALQLTAAVRDARAG
jgi:transketolase